MLFPFLRLLLIFHCLMLFSLESVANTDFLLQGQNYFQRGDFKTAIQYWDEAKNEVQKGTIQHIEILIRLANAYQHLGNHTGAKIILDTALELADNNQEAQKQQARIRSYLGDVLLAMPEQEFESAKKYLEEGMNLVAQDNSLTLAHLLNNLGNVLTVQQGYLTQKKDCRSMIEQNYQQDYSLEVLKFYADAQEHYTQAIQIAKKHEQGKSLQVQILINQVKNHLKQDATQASDQLGTILCNLFQKTRSLHKKIKKAKKTRNKQEIKKALSQLEKHFADFANQARDDLKKVLSQMRQLPNSHLNQASTLLKTALFKVRKLPDSYAKGFQLLVLGQLALKIQDIFPQKPCDIRCIYDIFTDASKLAEQHNQRLIADATGYMGQIYKRARRYPEALQLTKKTILFLQEAIYKRNIGMPQFQKSFFDLLYFWEWQRGHILQANQDMKGAEKAYEQALIHLYSIQKGLIQSQRDTQNFFRDRIRPVYYDLADLLLQQAAVDNLPEKEKQQFLHKAINTIERLKKHELQDYYYRFECPSFFVKVPFAQKDCEPTLPQSDRMMFSGLDKQTFLFYPIFLKERTELLLRLPNGKIIQKTVNVEADIINKVVVQFQYYIQIDKDSTYVTQSKQLYHWLIAPIRDKLKEDSTLVIVPNGTLHMIPMAALHDGQGFLVKNFALATIPSLEMTRSGRRTEQYTSISLNGVSDGVQGFPPLSHVLNEIEGIDQEFYNKKILLNQEFSREAFKQALQFPYAIVHVASHGQFDRDPTKTFVLTHDDKLSMDVLAQLLASNEFRRQPVDLLSLSACETAVGDERAAFGLAGIAVKTGVRSALASLWFVNDKSTAELMVEFYQQWQSPNSNLSKVQALRKAQEQLLIKYHPVRWAPFLLIGNWL